MADTKISALSSAGSLDGTETLPLVQAGANKKALLSVIATYINGLLGSTYQPLDSDLTAIAALSTTSFGRALLALADAAALRSAASLGTIAVEDEATAAQIQAGTASKAVAADKLLASASPQTLTDAATISWDMSTGYNAKVTLGGSRIFAAPTNAHAGLTYVLGVIQDATGSRTLTWNSAFDWGSVGAPILSTGAGKRDLIFMYCYDASAPSFRCTFSKSA